MNGNKMVNGIIVLVVALLAAYIGLRLVAAVVPPKQPAVDARPKFLAQCDGKVYTVRAEKFEVGADGCVSFFSGGGLDTWLCQCNGVSRQGEEKK